MNVIRPPFTFETATAKVRAAEDAWNSRDPQRVSQAYSEDSEWTNRDQFLKGAGSDSRASNDQVGTRTRLSVEQDTVELPQQPDSGSLSVRVPRRQLPAAYPQAIFAEAGRFRH